MKELMSTFLALLLVVSSLATFAGPAHAGDESATVTNGLALHGNGGGGTSGGDVAPDGDLEGDPENWLGGQNSVVTPADEPVDDGGIVVRIKKMLLRMLSFVR